MTSTITSTAERIRALNDAFRRTFVGGAVMITAGVEAMPLEQRRSLLAKVRAFDVFTDDNDPHGEHDFGAIDEGGVRCFWKRSTTTIARPRWARPIPLILPSRRACSPSCAPTNTEPGQRRSRASQGVAWAEATRSGSPNQGPRNANATRMATPMRATVRPSQST